MNEDIESKLQEFRIWALTVGRYSPSTVQRMVRRVNEFSGSIDLLKPDQGKILDIFAREVQQGKKPHTLNNQRKDLAAWMRFLGINMKLPVFREPPLPDPWIPTDGEVKRILSAAGKSGDRTSSSRNTIVVELLFFGGIRIGELIQINVGDLREKGIRIRSEKGEAERIIGLPAEMIRRIEEFISLYRYNSDPSALFTTRNGRVTYSYLRNVLRRIGARAGVSRFHAHAARHWCATALLRGIFGQKPLDIRMVQIHLGHRSLRTTQRYTHITQEEVAEQVRDRLSDFFQGDEPVTKTVKMHESFTAPHGAARIWTGVTDSQSP